MGNLWLTHYCITRKLEHLLPEGWKKSSIGRFYERNQTLDNDQQRNINLEEAIQLISTADNDFLPLTSDHKVKLLKNKRYFRAVDNRNLPRPDPANCPPECPPNRFRPNFAEYPPGTGTKQDGADGGASTSRNECRICMDQIQQSCTFLPCGHAGQCAKCARQIHQGGGKCPFCREDIGAIQ